MLDFTLKAYENYLKALKGKNIPFIRICDYLRASHRPERFCLLRHDVDRWPKRAFKMAMLESKLEIKSTYYFRTKKHTLKQLIIKKIEALGHEIGYHYESLSDTNGNIALALKDFEKNLGLLREFANVETCAMHGRPLKAFDNRDIWKVNENKKLLFGKFKLLGEAYLDIDYGNIMYINDTGRNWTNTKANLRDKVNSGVTKDFSSGKELFQYFFNEPHPQICFQVHPERWSDNTYEYIVSFAADKMVNGIKSSVKFIRRKL